MDKAKILRLCNQIEMIIVTVCNTGYTLQPCDEEAIFNRTKAIMDEVSVPPKTNADHIRQMTDEELAIQLEAFICNKIEECRREDIGCIDCAMKWLKQEVREDAGSKTD